MNVVTDLTARAVSFITLIQDTILKGSLASEKGNECLNISKIFQTDFDVNFPDYINSGMENNENFKIRAIELVWISTKAPEGATAVNYTVKLSIALVNWICKNKNEIFQKVKSCGSFPTPHSWREAVSEILYKDCKERVKLAKVLQYLPIQVVLALGGGYYNAPKQRILQVWEMDLEDQEALLTPDELKIFDNFYKVIDTKAETLLQSDEELLKELKQNNSPLPFELVFNHELDEISKNRLLRYQEQCLSGFEQVNEVAAPSTEINDPFAKAANMKLFALAFSGGGIRSATFNLGILQGLAKKGLINKFDYLSTVSGGGYIGSWLAAWIKRDGSVTKVSDRLNPEKSPDPFGEELRPIRWLRMFSNYFTPEASIMSVDAWTVGVTWLRNTLLNQLIILLLFLSILLSINIFYKIWIIDIWKGEITNRHVYFWSLILILPVALLAGLGMQSYHGERFPPVAIKREETGKVSTVILIILFAGAYMVSAWLFSNSDTSYFFYTQKLQILVPAAVVCFGGLSLIAIFGRYDKCIKSFGINTIKAWIIIFYTAAISALIGLFCLALVWELFEVIKVHSTKALPKQADIYNGLAFIVGLPIMMEVFGITMVTRMALLGRFFPDERREWWGRIGAVVHRIVFLYILLAGSYLLGKDIIVNIFHLTIGAAAAGGWIALVGSAVKAAFSSKTSGKGEKGFLSVSFDILARTGPYLFALGLLIFLPGLLSPLLDFEKSILKHFGFNVNSILNSITLSFILLLVMLIATYRLARRVGVNEFSMHHFYRNRLVRAYLGATRRRTERQKTFNPFTGFDMLDDVKLSELKNEYGYYGPYPILNTALNASQVTDLDRQDRKAESFIFSPLYCGFDFSMTRASADTKTKSYDYGFRQTEEFAYGNGPGIGTAMAISGAAVDPNQGYHSSAATAFLLTVFNVRMGWWIGNPRKSTWKEADPRFGLGYIIYNLIGKTDTRNDFVCLSDGGHFDNMGLYELVRRRCSFIILGDGEQDNNFTCEGLANAIRRCRIDFGAEIDINIDEITSRDENNFSKRNYSRGWITYAGDTEPSGMLLYIKSSITSEEPVDVREYSKKNPTFPHQTTGDQFFDEEQFESYRKLGLHIADLALSDSIIRKALHLKLPEVSAGSNSENTFRNDFSNFLDKTKTFLANNY